MTNRERALNILHYNPQTAFRLYISATGANCSTNGLNRARSKKRSHMNFAMATKLTENLTVSSAGISTGQHSMFRTRSFSPLSKQKFWKNFPMAPSVF